MIHGPLVTISPFHLGMFSPYLVFDSTSILQSIATGNSKFSLETYHLNLVVVVGGGGQTGHVSVLRPFCLGLHSSELDIDL